MTGLGLCQPQADECLRCSRHRGAAAGLRPLHGSVGFFSFPYDLEHRRVGRDQVDGTGGRIVLDIQSDASQLPSQHDTGFENPAEHPEPEHPAPSRDATGGKLSGLSATTRDRMWTFVGHTRISFEKTRMITSDTWTDHDTFEGTGSVDRICSPTSTQNSEWPETLIGRTQPTGPTEADPERIFDPVCGASHAGGVGSPWDRLHGLHPRVPPKTPGQGSSGPQDRPGAPFRHTAARRGDRHTPNRAPPGAFSQVRTFFFGGAGGTRTHGRRIMSPLL